MTMNLHIIFGSKSVSCSLIPRLSPRTNEKSSVLQAAGMMLAWDYPIPTPLHTLCEPTALDCSAVDDTGPSDDTT